MKKAFLLHPKHSYNADRDLLSNDRILIQDLELDTVLQAMSRGDRLVRDVCRSVLLKTLKDPDTIRYRQDVLRDCLRNPKAVRDLYDLSQEAVQTARRHPLAFLSLTTPSSVLSSSLDLLSTLLDVLMRVRSIAREYAGRFRSRGFGDFFSVFAEEIDAECLETLEGHLGELQDDAGLMISVGLGPGNVSVDHTLRRQTRRRRSRFLHMICGWVQRLLGRRSSAFRLRVDPHDPSSNRTLENLKHRAIGPMTNTLARSAERLLDVMRSLRTELAFCIGCLNLAEQLAQIPKPIIFPLLAAPGERTHSFMGLYDVCLALTIEDETVSNDVDMDGKDLVVITGANQGGKTTFLRSIGVAQLMMQCGMFVPAESYCADICSGIFTHYRREEDASMERGKLDEELLRMNNIVDALRPNAMVLFNESFAATNEREGSGIAKQVVSGLLDKRIKVFFVTHLYEFACGFRHRDGRDAMFLRAERKEDGQRTFRMVEGPPLQTSFGMDLYDQIFDPIC